LAFPETGAQPLASPFELRKATIAGGIGRPTLASVISAPKNRAHLLEAQGNFAAASFTGIGYDRKIRGADFNPAGLARRRRCSET
jgi:hypothetical protein